jgi:NADPH:quinone reductase-like Zn-dependent oxidoreductase
MFVLVHPTIILIFATMNALILHKTQQLLQYGQVPAKTPEKGCAVVQIQAAALNHRDLFICEGLYPGIKTPCILGSDGAGEWRGKKVVLYPALAWGSNPKYQGKDFRVLGMPEDGTFAEQIKVPRANIFLAPDHLNGEQAAALPLAGLTAWRTIFTRCQLKKGENILITGVGGGVALMALQMAVAVGAAVYITSGSTEKIEKAVAMGAKHGENYREVGWDKRLKQVSGGFDVIVDAAGGDGFALLPAICNPGARIGFYGGTLGQVNGLSLQPIFWKQISLLGSTMGSPQEFKAMLAFVQKKGIVPVVDTVYQLCDGNLALEKMRQGGQFGKLVLKVVE